VAAADFASLLASGCRSGLWDQYGPIPAGRKKAPEQVTERMSRWVL